VTAFKLTITGTLAEIPAPYAPMNYHHPGPTLDCMKKCLKECFPSLKRIELTDNAKHDEQMRLYLEVKHIMKADAVGITLRGILDVLARHLPEGMTVTAVINLTPPVAFKLATS